MLSSVLDALGLGARQRPAHAECVGHVAELNLFPVKSCARMPMQRLVTSQGGMKHPDCELYDRHIMVTTENHRFVSIRKYPQMTQIRVTLNDASLQLDAPGMDALTLPLNHDGQKRDCEVWGKLLGGVDCGDVAAAWMTSYLGVAVRLMFTSRQIEARGFPQLSDNKWHQVAAQHHKLGFQDFAPFMLASAASLRDLNNRLDDDVTMNHFRPNIVVEGAAAAFDEDEWLEVYVGDDVRFKNLRPCTRCVMITVNPDTGEKDPTRATLETLKTYRIDDRVSKTAPLFGIHLFLEWPGEIRVGDPVYIVRGPLAVPE